MKSKHIYPALALFLSLIILIPVGFSCSKKKSFPHVLIITIDGLRPDSLSWFGNKKYQTPNLDQIAEKGVSFREAITPAPLVLPGHASLFTGLYPENHKVRCNGVMRLDDEFETLAEILRGKGYETAAVVGSSFLHHQYGLDQGFDDYFDDFSEGLYFGSGKIKLKGKDVTLHGIKRLQARFPQKPMFLWVNYADLAGIRAERYEIMMQYLDAQVGELVKEIPTDRKALILITSTHAIDTNMKGIMQTGYSLDDDSIRVPLILSGPGLPQGKVISGQAGIMDIPPTLLELIGIKPSANIIGKSLASDIEAGSLSQRKFHIESEEPYCEMGWPALRGILDGEKLSMQTESGLFADPDKAAKILDMLAEADELVLHHDHKGAENLFKQALEENPDNLRALKELGWIYFYSNKIHEAKELFLQAGESKKNDPEAVTGLAACELVDNNPASAEKLLASLEKSGILPHKYYFYYGKLMMQKQEFEKAAQMLEQAVSLDPLDRESRLLLGQTLIQQGKTREGIRHLEQAIALDPNYLEAFQELERIHAQVLNNSLKAEAYREKIKKLMKRKE
jgi:Flp pilus assembly protein TadD